MKSVFLTKAPLQPIKDNKISKLQLRASVEKNPAQIVSTFWERDAYGGGDTVKSNYIYRERESTDHLYLTLSGSRHLQIEPTK